MSDVLQARPIYTSPVANIRKVHWSSLHLTHSEEVQRPVQSNYSFGPGISGATSPGKSSSQQLKVGIGRPMSHYMNSSLEEEVWRMG